MLTPDYGRHLLHGPHAHLPTTGLPMHLVRLHGRLSLLLLLLSRFCFLHAWQREDVSHAIDVSCVWDLGVSRSKPRCPFSGREGDGEGLPHLLRPARSGEGQDRCLRGCKFTCCRTNGPIIFSLGGGPKPREEGHF